MWYLSRDISVFLYSYHSNKRRVANNSRVWKKHLNLINERSGTNEWPGIFVTLYEEAFEISNFLIDDCYCTVWNWLQIRSIFYGNGNNLKGCVIQNCWINMAFQGSKEIFWNITNIRRYYATWKVRETLLNRTL